MQIIHKLYREDIIEILEEKYGITTDKITVARDKLTEDIAFEGDKTALKKIDIAFEKPTEEVKG